ncbi:MAG TPA: pyridoxal phosphate-dependent aminotransferase [Candidatus Anaerotignum merdipullorum]|nr:pyridoxal phosphate-dependent aminotransferase [Candidatus Anaerotignum merdipullorum]
MISTKMKEMVEQSAALSAMFTEGKRLAEIYGAENVYDFGIGNPNVPAPETVRSAAMDLLQHTDVLQLHSYTDSSGIPAVRKAIADNLNRRFGKAYTEQNLIMTVGAAGGLNVICKTLLDAGEEILTFAPYFGEYDNYAKNVGAVLRAVPPNPPDFLPDLNRMAEMITQRTKVVLINSPNNPTGVIYDAETIAKLADVLEQKEKEFGTSIYLISDEPYRELAYDGRQVPDVTTYYHNAIVVYSYSKSLSLPGDRIGYLLIPSTVDAFEDVIMGAGIANRVLGFVNAPALQQMIVARCCEEVTDVAFYNGNRDLLYQALREYGYECAKPQGAFYLFVRALEEDDVAFCERAKQYRLLLTPGSAFGCKGYVRISYCVARKTIEQALPSFLALAESYQKK